MPCYSPLLAVEDGLTKAGKINLRFLRGKNLIDDILPQNRDGFFTLPCGQCIGCRLERSRQWAIRCVHEAQMHERNCFITLTFSDEELSKRSFPESLDVRDFQLFMKRLRKRFGNGIRFFHCGEYGSLRKRPHYHACIFGFDFPDRELWKRTNDVPLYRSAILEELWPYGHSSVGDVTFESAAYVARYICEKINGEAAKEHYLHIDLDTGECFDRKPEYTTMSRRPGIGGAWFRNFYTDVFPSDECVIRGGIVTNPPKFYGYLYEQDNPEDFARIKALRLEQAVRFLDDNSSERLFVKEKVHRSKVRSLVRDLE